ncbi:TonB-dependent receptor domain-containing protein [Acinetobacter sp.]|uniref:TonB-dependent receptor domain-containing protein n=1 Tax=Acinetobacter sp. TaxID=472 RepID=UPI002FC70053
MHPISKTLLGSLFILSPLSAAMAETLPTINVTANRTVTPDQHTMAGVTVIDRAEIERKQFNSLTDLLKTVPSISMRSNGGEGKTSGISLRGTKSNNVLVLVDGQKVGSATTGAAAFEHFPIDQIERVEVIRGPRSSLYGAEAIGGVIQIFTRKGSQDGIKPFASMTYGSHETYDGNIGVHVKEGNSWATLSLAGRKTQGINTTAPTGWGYDPDKDGYENKSVSVRAGHQFNDQFSLEGNVLYTDGKNEYDSSPNIYSNINQNIYGVTAKYKPINVWETEFKIGRTEDKLETVASTTSHINTERNNASWLNTLSLHPQHTLMFGVDYQDDKVTSETAYTLKERNNIGYFTQYLGAIGAVDLQAAVRFDDNEQYGDHTTGNASVGYRFNDDYTAYAAWGKAFRTPTFNELYWPGAGNVNLKPEEAENIEIGFKGRQWLDWQLNIFNNEFDNMIVGWPAINIDKARIQGGELEVGQNLSNWMWNVNYTYQKPEDRGNTANKGKQAVYIPKQLLNVSADYKMDKWTVGGSVHAEDKRYTNPANTQYLGAFATADVRVAYQATPEFSIQAKLANMFDKEYQTNKDYNQDGRTAWVTLRYAMK